MTLLLFYFTLALGVSFVCSLAEATLLSTPRAYAATLAQKGRAAGVRVQRMQAHIDRPLGAILTLNTVAHTIGAAGVGAQAQIVWGKEWLTLVSAVLTLAVLIFSEIIPKTLGAVHWERLLGPVSLMIQGMVYITYPLLIALDAIGKMLRGGHKGSGLSRDQIALIAEIGRTEGALNAHESQIILSLLRLSEVKVEDVMTPRTVVFMVPDSTTAEDVSHEQKFAQFTRIPVFGKSPDDVVGVVLKQDVYEALRNDKGGLPLSELVRKLHAVPETAPVLTVLEEFGRLGHHMFLVVDEYGGTSGVVTLEDVLESVIGKEIVDETDRVADLRRAAGRKRQKHRHH